MLSFQTISPLSSYKILTIIVPPAGLELAANGLGKHPASNRSGKAVLSFLVLLRPGTRPPQADGSAIRLLYPSSEGGTSPFYSAPGRTRTGGQRIRNPLLYPSELRGHLSP